MKSLLLHMKKIRDKVFHSRKEGLSYYYLHSFDVTFNRIISQGFNSYTAIKNAFLSKSTIVFL